ncbi:MAG: hypothetical protein MUC59_07475 [Saprospiraceae bacterium]|nr:hypothetical protein [Saprospiraceae bacterium]
MFLFVFDYHFLENNWSEAIGSTLLELLTYAAIIYLNLFLLIPKLLKTKRLGWYVMSLTAVVRAGKTIFTTSAAGATCSRCC